MIPTYNCARYLRETLASVLQQDPGPAHMQIEVIDDHSTKDDPEAVVRELGKGRVTFYRQPQNVGHVRNFATCLLRSRGQLIHQLPGDDLVRDGFYRKLEPAFAQHPEIGLAYCRQIHADENGHWQMISALEQPTAGCLRDACERFVVDPNIQTPAVVVRRVAYEQLGGFDRRLSWSEDWEMWVRIAARYPVWYEPEPLAVYRQHANSSSSRQIQTGENMRDVRRALSVIQEDLGTDHFKRLRQPALENRASYALGLAHAALLRRQRGAAFVQIWEANKTQPSLLTLGRSIALLIGFLVDGIRWKLKAWRRVR